MICKNFVLAVMPSELPAALRYPVALAALSYRIVGGRLMRDASGGTVGPGKGVIPVVCDAGFDGQPFDLRRFGGDVAAELAAREASGVVADFARPDSPVLRDAAGELARVARRAGVPLYTSPAYAAYAPGAHVLIGSHVSEGSLKAALTDACARYGAGQVALEVIPMRIDCPLPAEDGGARLTEEELAEKLRQLAPMTFFSSELCSKYFTYLAPDRRAHFVLYDDASTIRAKLQTARSCGVDTAFLLYAEVAEMLPELLAE